ncbi:MAG: hypothetical protein NT027_12530 [Proteobacteria bacterium]|nr:hypothetical protein [Pseudomonadota bacterium]
MSKVGNKIADKNYSFCLVSNRPLFLFLVVRILIGCFLTLYLSEPLRSQTLLEPQTGSPGSPKSEHKVVIEVTPDFIATPVSYRLSIFAGDQGGGPVRFNTRFPTESIGQNPTSYYHTQAFAGFGLEVTVDTGAILIESIVRRDLAHPNIESRIIDEERDKIDQKVINDFSFDSVAIVTGWAFGSPYRQAWWRASLSVLTERTNMRVNIQDRIASSQQIVTATYTLWSWSLRARAFFQIAQLGPVDFLLGPEIHLPIYSFVISREDAGIPNWMNERLDLRSSAAIGASFAVSYGF